MTDDVRTYLRQRFLDDAQQLRDRVAQMQRGTALPGPDAATSQKMADACDDVVHLIDTMVTDQNGTDVMQQVLALVPQLEQKAQRTAAPLVRAVYMGAATRCREVVEVEGRS